MSFLYTEPAAIHRLDGRSPWARFRITDAPYAVVIRAIVLPDDASVGRYEVVLRTSITEALPSLALRPRGLLHEIGKALHVAREIEIGDPAIDAPFWITGSLAAAAVLTPAVRASLAQLTSHGPLLRLGNGMATLSWSGPWRHVALAAFPDAALDVLAGVRLAIETG